ncbi:(2Fe-2S)-binding protein [Halobacteriales archaeon QS_1_67_19]|nr:MAG: (2Fe-2S)-binding protein [Halobacteriales archaeon QS_1_67_19]
MADSVRVTVETDGDEQTARIYDDGGEVETDGATFRFSLNTDSDDDSESAGGDPTDGFCGDEPRRLALLETVPEDGTLRCEAVDDRRGVEFILGRDGGGAFAWRNSCPHKPEVRLDPGDGAILTDDHVVCHEHGARFERDDGYCTRGPCRGAALDEIEVAVREGVVYLTDDRFEAGRRLPDA